MKRIALLVANSLARFLVVVALCACLSSDHCVGQLQVTTQVPEADWKRGYHGLGLICRNSGLETRTEPQWQQHPDSDSILIVLGKNRPRMPFDFDAFLRNGGAVLFATDWDDENLADEIGITFVAGQFTSRRSGNSFRQFRDCPLAVVINNSHPVTRNLNRIVTNRPGLVRSFNSGNRQIESSDTLARLPLLQQRTNNLNFVKAIEYESGGRILCVADQSVFANQMITKGDNALFAIQAINWLRDGRRNNLMIISDGRLADMLDPADIEMLLPPPTRDQILEALKNLPADELIEFGNTVATVIEDENMVNEFMGQTFDRLPDVIIRRSLILFGTIAIAIFAFITFFWRSNISGQSNRDAAGLVHQNSRRNNLVRAGNERRLAAESILESFSARIAGRSLDLWPDFPQTITIRGSRERAKRALAEMHQARNMVRVAQAKYWTPERLSILEQQAKDWHELYESGVLSCDAKTTELAATS